MKRLTSIFSKKEKVDPNRGHVDKWVLAPMPPEANEPIDKTVLGESRLTSGERIWVHQIKGGGEGKERRYTRAQGVLVTTSDLLYLRLIRRDREGNEKEVAKLEFADLQGIVFGTLSPVLSRRPTKPLQDPEWHCMSLITLKGPLDISFNNGDVCMEWYIAIQELMPLAKRTMFTRATLNWQRASMRLNQSARVMGEPVGKALAKVLTNSSESLNQAKLSEKFDLKPSAASPGAVDDNSRSRSDGAVSGGGDGSESGQADGGAQDTNTVPNASGVLSSESMLSKMGAGGMPRVVKAPVPQKPSASLSAEREPMIHALQMGFIFTHYAEVRRNDSGDPAERVKPWPFKLSQDRRTVYYGNPALERPLKIRECLGITYGTLAFDPDSFSRVAVPESHCFTLVFTDICVDFSAANDEELEKAILTLSYLASGQECLSVGRFHWMRARYKLAELAAVKGVPRGKILMDLLKSGPCGDNLRIVPSVHLSAQTSAKEKQSERQVESGLQVSAVEYEPNGGKFMAPKVLKMSCKTRGAKIHYTTDGTIPTYKSPLYSLPITVREAGTYRLQAVAMKIGLENSAMASSELIEVMVEQKNRVVAPTITPHGGRHNMKCEVTMACETPGAKLLYTDFGTIPKEGAEGTYEYSGSALMLKDVGTHTISVVAVRHGMSDSSVVSATFRIDPQQAKTVIFDPPDLHGGSFLLKVLVSMSCPTRDAVIRYTTNGTLPTATSPEYKSPILWDSISPATGTILTAVAFERAMLESEPSTVTFFVDEPQKDQVWPPIVLPKNGTTHTKFAKMVLQSKTPNTQLYYTLNGTIPNRNSLKYDKPVVLDTLGEHTITAVAVKDYMTDSDAVVSTVTVKKAVLKPNDNDDIQDVIKMSLRLPERSPDGHLILSMDDVPVNWTVDQFKDHLVRDHHVQTQGCRMVTGGRVMTNDRTLLSYNRGKAMTVALEKILGWSAQGEGDGARSAWQTPSKDGSRTPARRPSLSP